MSAKPTTIVQVSDHSPLGDFVYRVHEPAAALGQLGGVEVYDVHYASRYRDEAAIAADILIIYLVIDIELFRVIKQRRRLGKPTFCEINDYFFDVHPWNKAYKNWSDPRNQQLFINLMRCSDAAQVSSESLAARFAKYNRFVGVFPNQIAVLPAPREPRTGGRVVVGWGGSGGHLKDLESAAPIWKRWLAQHPEALLKVMGSPSFERYFTDAPKDRFRFEIAGSLEHYCKFLRTLDVGLAPLLPTDYNRCRSDVKFVEYAAHGVVSVMQRLDPYLKTVRHGETGFLVDGEADLFATLDRLAAAPALREQVAQAAYNYVKRERLLHKHVKRRLEFYREHERRIRPAQPPTVPDALRRLDSVSLRGLPGLEQAGNHYWRLKPNSPAEQKFLEGMDIMGRQDFARATATFLEAIQLAPDYYQAHYFAGRCYSRQGKLVEAERAYLQATKINSFYLRAWRALKELHSSIANGYARKCAELSPPLT